MRLTDDVIRSAVAALGGAPREYDHAPLGDGLELFILPAEDRQLVTADAGARLVRAARSLALGPAEELPGVELADVLEAYTLIRQHLGGYIDRLGLDRIPLNSDE